MEKQNNQSKTIIILLSVIIFLSLAFGIYVLFFNKDNDGNVDNNQNNETGEKEEKKPLYHIVDGEEATILDTINSSPNDKISISFDYPQFDIDSEEIKEINTAIEKIYKRDYDINFSREINEFSEFGIEKNGKYYCNGPEEAREACEFHYITYNISSNDDYLAIYFTENIYCHCSGGSNIFGYVIDKKTNKVLTNSEIVKLFDKNEQDVIDEYNKHIDGVACLDESDKAKTINDVKLQIENGELSIIRKGC